MRHAILYKQRQKYFAVSSNIKQFKIPQYNALKDPFLIGYFDNPAIKKHLKETGIITKKKFRVNKSSSKRPYSNQRSKDKQLYKKFNNTARQSHPLKLPAVQDYLIEHSSVNKINYSKNHKEDNDKEIKKTKRKSLSVGKAYNQQNKSWNSMKNEVKIGQIQKKNVENQEQHQRNQNLIKQQSCLKKQKFQEKKDNNKINQNVQKPSKITNHVQQKQKEIKKTDKNMLQVKITEKDNIKDLQHQSNEKHSIQIKQNQAQLSQKKGVDVSQKKGIDLPQNNMVESASNNRINLPQNKGIELTQNNGIEIQSNKQFNQFQNNQIQQTHKPIQRQDKINQIVQNQL